MITIIENQVSPFLSAMASRIKNTKPLMAELSEQMVQAGRENIETEGQSLLGKKWDNLSPFTRAIKQSRARSPKALQDSGRLISTLSKSYTDTSAIAGTNKIYAALMHFGGTVRAKKRLGSVSRKKDVWAMEQYFWRQWYLSNKKETGFKLMALHVARYGKFEVPPRPFLGLGQIQQMTAIQTIQKFIVLGK